MKNEQNVVRVHTHTHTHTHTHGYFKKNKGITLVALVVTIVVLIILATISINIVFGEEGIVERVRQAKQDMANAQEEEKQILADAANSMDKHIVGERETVTVDKEQYEQLLKDVETLKSNAQDYYYEETWTSLTATSSNVLSVKSYQIPEDGVYVARQYSHWPSFTNTIQAPRYNRITQTRGAESISFLQDGDSGYGAGDTQTTNTTEILNCEKGDIINFYVIQYSGVNKTVDVTIKLTRMN